MPDWFVLWSERNQRGLPEKCVSERDAEEKANQYRTMGREAFVYQEWSFEDYHQTELSEVPTPQQTPQEIPAVKQPRYLLINKSANYYFAKHDNDMNLIAFATKNIAVKFTNKINKDNPWQIEKIQDEWQQFVKKLLANGVQFVFVVNDVADAGYRGDTINIKTP
jgi:hypothetical protein